MVLLHTRGSCYIVKIYNSANNKPTYNAQELLICNNKIILINCSYFLSKFITRKPANYNKEYFFSNLLNLLLLFYAFCFFDDDDAINLVFKSNKKKMKFQERTTEIRIKLLIFVCWKLLSSKASFLPHFSC